MPSIEEYPEHPPTNQLPSGSSIITRATVGALVGVFFVSPIVGVPVHIVSVAFCALLFVAVSYFKPRYFLAVRAYNKRKAAYLAQRKAIRERAAALEAEYTEAYEKFLPTWQQWEKDARDFEKAYKEHKAWLQQQEAARAKMEERRALARAKLYDAYHVIQMRAKLQLEVTDQKHLLALFRETVKALAPQHPELGLLHGSGEFPEKHVQDVLPPKPPLPLILKEHRQPPPKPRRPRAPPPVVVSEDSWGGPVPSAFIWEADFNEAGYTLCPPKGIAFMALAEREAQKGA